MASSPCPRCLCSLWGREEGTRAGLAVLQLFALGAGELHASSLLCSGLEAFLMPQLRFKVFPDLPRVPLLSVAFRQRAVFFSPLRFFSTLSM